MHTPDYPVVLVVEDTISVRGMLYFALKQAGFRTLEASDGWRAVDLYRQHKGVIDLVLMDVLMPGLDGPATLDLLREIDPAVRCCFMTGEVEQFPDEELMQRGAAAVLKKPFTISELVGTIRCLLPSEAAV